MRYTNTKSGYGLVARALHWSMALGIFGLFVLGWWMRKLTYYSPYYKTAPELHQSIGIVLLVLLVFRILWKLFNKSPDDSDLTTVERNGSKLLHWGFYPLLLALMLAGYFISTLDGRSIPLFWLVDVPSIYSQKGLEDLAGKLHWFLAYLTIAIALLHGGAALWHHFIKRDNVLKRMIKSPSET